MIAALSDDAYVTTVYLLHNWHKWQSKYINSG